jgi:hypothetical protein
MTQITQTKCPNCGAATLPAMGRFYCARCGWNRDAAERRLVRVQWLLPALIVIFDLMGAVALGMERGNWPGAILFAALPTLLLGFVLAGARQGLARLRVPLTETAALDRGARAGAAHAESQSAERYDFLASSVPPRLVRLTRRGRRMVNWLLLLVFIMEGLLIWALWGMWYRAETLGESRSSIALPLCLMALVAGFAFFVRRGMVRDKKRMENGAVAIARVTEQRNLRNASGITYEFEDRMGRTVTGLANDLTRSLEPGMKVAVFYDAQDAKRQVAACASFFEIVNPGERQS